MCPRPLRSSLRRRDYSYDDLRQAADALATDFGPMSHTRFRFVSFVTRTKEFPNPFTARVDYASAYS